MNKLPICIFAIFFISAIVSCYDGYQNAKHCMRQDLNQALYQTMAYRGIETMRQDSIRAYKAMAHHDGSTLTIILEDKILRHNLRNACIKDIAYIACDVKENDGKYEVKFRSEAPCSASMLLSLSDQRLTFALSIMAAMSLLWVTHPLFRKRQQQLAPANTYGGLHYDEAANRFVTAQGKALHLTPMQSTLMRMFFDSNTHTLPKTAICDALWPKKPDASDTLYTLIRRLKPVIEQHTNLRIESDRGRSYTLTINDVE